MPVIVSLAFIYLNGELSSTLNATTFEDGAASL